MSAAHFFTWPTSHHSHLWNQTFFNSSGLVFKVVFPCGS